MKKILNNIIGFGIGIWLAAIIILSFLMHPIVGIGVTGFLLAFGAWLYKEEVLKDDDT